MRNQIREWLQRYLPAEILSLVATSAADVTFYIPAIISYELSKKTIPEISLKALPRSYRARTSSCLFYLSQIKPWNSLSTCW